MAPTSLSSSTSTSSLPSSHPLISELTSLRQQLFQYQKAAHQSSIQLQGARLELALAKEENVTLREQGESFRRELDVLRQNPSPPPPPKSSHSLSELSLAHRRLSAKLDLAESQLSSSRLELAASQSECVRLGKEREMDRSVINDLRRIEEDREEEIEWEKGERRRVEEEKKLCDLALQEYSTLVHSLDPSAVPPPVPSKSSSTNILQSPPELNSSAPLESPGILPSTSTTSDNISNLLIGQRGVHQLFKDFTSTLTGKEKSIHELQARVEELRHTLGVVEEQLKAETRIRVLAQVERDKALRDDASAARVVERYMTFTQKTHATVHMHLDNLRTRSGATQTSLRQEVLGLKQQLKLETARANKLRGATDEMTEGLSREAAGRRREVALRLKQLAVEERRERKVEAWLDHVRRSRDGAEGAVLEADMLENLLDEGIEAVSVDDRVKDQGKEKKNWRGMLGGKRKGSANIPNGHNFDESSLARVLLAEDLVNMLVLDFQVEQKRRIELESQRVEWLAKEAADGVAPEGDSSEDTHPGDMVFDLGDHDVHADEVDGEKTGPTPPPKEGDTSGSTEEHETSSTNSVPIEAIIAPLPATSPLPEESILHPQLRQIFAPLSERYDPVQKSLHDLSISLASLRSSLPVPAEAPDSPNPARPKKPFLNVSLKTPHPTTDPVFLNLLDGIHEVIEDARVDVEIAVADEERVFRGFEALLGVGGSTVQGKEVLKDAREYVDQRKDGEGYHRLIKRVEDVEGDLAEIKRKVHEVDGMEMEKDDAVDGKPNRKLSIWSTLDLKTVTPTSSRLISASPDIEAPNSPDLDHRRRATSIFSNVGSVGRSFSASVIGTPRRMTSGLYRGINGGRKGEYLPVDGVNGHEDDVE